MSSRTARKLGSRPSPRAEASGPDDEGASRARHRAPVAIFDSGVGGLSILRHIRQALPAEELVFFADQAHVPYGPRSLDEVRRFSTGIARFLVGEGAKLIVVACNTASAAALHDLRAAFPTVPFVGMEPAVKPAAARTLTGTVGVLATPATFQGALFSSVVERFAGGVQVLPQTLPGLVERIEAGDLDGPETRRIVEAGVRPLIERGADTLVLACTHYPLVIPLVAEVAGPGVEVIDPSPAIARQTERLLDDGGLRSGRDRRGRLTIVTTGESGRLSAMVRRLLGEAVGVRSAAWDDAGRDVDLIR